MAVTRSTAAILTTPARTPSRARGETAANGAKLATVVFVDLVESTKLVSGADPEVVRRRVNTFFERATRCMERHGGLVEKFAGDAVMAAPSSATSPRRSSSPWPLAGTLVTTTSGRRRRHAKRSRTS